MRVFNILEEFGVYELGSSEEVYPILEKINTTKDNEIELNLTGCVPDYPVTALIIDKIVTQLKEIKGEKKLSIILDYELPIGTLANWLFLGSKEFGISEKRSLAYSEISNLISTFCAEHNIKIDIIVRNFKTNKIITRIELNEKQI